jgi:hypothetical protein
LVKRTRRNLSDPRIKKIIKAQLSKHSTTSKPPYNQYNEGTAGKFFLIFVLFLLFSVTALLLYVNWSDVNRFLDTTFSNGSPAKQTSTSAPSPGPGSESTTESRQEQAPQPTEPAESPEKPALQPVARNIQVEVLNGCGKDGLARRVTEFLRKKEVDVVSQGNYLNFDVRNSIILDRVDNPERASQLAKILGISRDQIQVKKDSNLQLDATVVLGADYKSLEPFTN